MQVKGQQNAHKHDPFPRLANQCGSGTSLPASAAASMQHQMPAVPTAAAAAAAASPSNVKLLQGKPLTLSLYQSPAGSHLITHESDKSVTGSCSIFQRQPA